MKSRGLIASILLMALILALIPYSVLASNKFTDMPNNWSTEALNRAVDNGLLNGYEEDGQKLIKPSNNITRAELIAVVNRAFGAQGMVELEDVMDVPVGAWYEEEMAKALHMRVLTLDAYLRPNAQVTRQEAFTILARAFRLSNEDTNVLNMFTDKKYIADWALDSMAAMVEAGYIQGSSKMLNPRANLTRAEFAVVMDNLVKQYIVDQDNVNKLVEEGNVVIRRGDITLNNVVINGDLIIADGVQQDSVLLNNVTVKGRVLVRGGGEIAVSGDSDLTNVLVYKIEDQVSIKTEGDSLIKEIYVQEGSADIAIDGKVQTLKLASSALTVMTEKNAIIQNVEIHKENVQIRGTGAVKNVDVLRGGDNSLILTSLTKVNVDKSVKGVFGGTKQIEGGSSSYTVIPARLSGEIAVTGDVEYASVLTVDTQKLKDNTGFLLFTWKRNGKIIQQGSSSQYVPNVEDIGGWLSVEVVSTVQKGVFVKNIGTVAKAKTKAPTSAPIIISKTKNSVVLKAIEGMEYKTAGGIHQSSAKFECLSMGVEYSFSTRYKETQTHKASAWSPVVKITPQLVYIESIKLEKSKIVMQKGESEKLTAQIYPTNASSPYVMWTSSDPNIVSVDDEGNIVGVSTGTAFVTAKEKNSVASRCVVTVLDEAPVQALGIYEDTIIVPDADNLLVLDVDTLGAALPTAARGSIDTITTLSVQDESITVYGRISVQGSSTAYWPKKNWTLSFFLDEQREQQLKLKVGESIASTDWVAKADWIDPTMLRNALSYTLWGSMTESRETFPMYEVDNAWIDMNHMPASMQFEAQGFPRVYPMHIKMNESHHGIYILTLSHDPQNFNIDINNPSHMYIEFDSRGGYTTEKTWEKFRRSGIGQWIDGYYPKNENMTVAQKEAIDEFGKFINGPIEDFERDFDKYLDKTNMIDMLLFIEATYDWDAIAQDLEIVTYDLQKWYMLPWDKDTTFGMYWDGSGILEGSEYDMVLDYFVPSNDQIPWYKLYTVFQEDIEKRYAQLRDNGVFTVENLELLANDITDKIPKELWDAEYALWRKYSRPSINETSKEQILQWFGRHLIAMDEHFNYSK